jgi:hypothetical protein
MTDTSMADIPIFDQEMDQLVTARNHYLTAVERSLIANEAYLLSTLFGYSDTDKASAILERSETGLSVKNTMAEYLKARDAWWHANRETTP